MHQFERVKVIADLSMLNEHFAMVGGDLFLEVDLSLGQLRSGELLLLNLLLVVFLAVADVSMQVNTFCSETCVLVGHLFIV